MYTSVSNDYMKYCMYCGIPPNLYVFMQTMGHMDHQLDVIPGTNVFEIHYGKTLVSLAVALI